MEETVSLDPPYSYYTSGESAPAAKHFAQLSGTDIYYECNTVAEVWDGDGVTDLYYPALTRFYFTVSQSSGLLASTAQKCDVNQYTKYVDNYLDEIETSSRNDEMYLPFLATHDNDRTAGYLPSMNYLGQMTANLLLLGPGSPFIYYGEELGGARLARSCRHGRQPPPGYGPGRRRHGRESVRRTYSADNRADAPASEQIKSGTSLYTYYIKLIMIRKAYPEFVRGDYTALQLNGTKVGGFISDWNGPRVAPCTTQAAATQWFSSTKSG